MPLTLPSPQRSEGESGKLFLDDALALVDGQEAPVQLQHDQIAGRHVDGADVAGPAAVAILLAQYLAIQLVAKSVPFVFALAVDDLRIVQVGVVPVAERAAGRFDVAEVFLTVLQQLGDVLAFGMAGFEQASDGGGGDGRPAPAAPGVMAAPGATGGREG